MIQDEPVRALSSLILASTALVACAHTSEDVHTTVVVSESAPSTINAADADREVIAVDTPPPPAPVPRGRPRLSQTVTLGETQYAPLPPPAPAGPSGPPVIVNNNIVVQGSAPYYGGYAPYGAYGRFGYGSSTPTYGDGRSFGSRGAGPRWGSTGWEGAQRTAAPGQTPAIGGNWSPPPSYGPAQMK